VRVAVEGVTKGVEGVTSVENQIIVEEMGPAGHAFVEVTEELQRERADAVVEARVNLALLEALGGEARDIAVVAEDGTVTLIGTVEDEVHHEDVLSRVRDVEGVEQVVDELRCGP